MPRIGDPVVTNRNVGGKDQAGDVAKNQSAAEVSEVSKAKAERTDLYVRENGALSFPEGTRLTPDDKMERARRLLEVMRTKQEAKLTFGGRVSLAGVDPAASLRNYYGALKVASKIAEKAPDLDSAIVEFVKTVGVPSDLRPLAFAAAGVDASVKPEAARALSRTPNNWTAQNAINYAMQNRPEYLLQLVDDVVKQFPQAGYPLDLNGLLSRATQPIRGDVALALVRFFARANEVKVPGLGVSDWNAVAAALPKNAEGAGVLARLAKSFNKAFDEIDFHGKTLSETRLPKSDGAPRRVVGGLGDVEYQEVNEFTAAFSVGDDRFTRQTDDSLRRHWQGQRPDLQSFVGNGDANYKVGLLHVFARAKEIGLGVVVNTNTVSWLTQHLPSSQESVDALRRLCRAFGYSEQLFQMPTDATRSQMATLDRFPPTRGLPPKRLAPGEALGTQSFSGDKAQEMLVNRDRNLFEVDDDTIEALATKTSRDISVGFYVASQAAGDPAWVKGAMKLWERSIELDPTAIGQNTSGFAGTGRIGDFIRNLLQEPAMSDPAAMQALARVVVRAGIDPTGLTTSSGWSVMWRGYAGSNAPPSVFGVEYERAKRVLQAETAPIPHRRPAKKLWQDGQLGHERMMERHERDAAYGHRDARLFKIDDDSIRNFGPFDIGTWVHHFNNPEVFSFVGRLAELNGGQSSQFSYYITQYLYNPVPPQFSTDQAIPHLCRMAASVGLAFDKVFVTPQEGKPAIKLSDHPLVRGTDAASASTRSNAIAADVGKLDPAHGVDDAARMQALRSLFGGGNDAHEFSELLPALMKARLDGKLAGPKLSANDAADIAKTIAGAFDHVGAAAVALALSTGPIARDALLDALIPITANKHHAAQWIGVIDKLRALSGDDLKFALADALRDPTKPDFTTLAIRLDLVGTPVTTATIKRRFDQEGKFDPPVFAKVVIERALLAPKGGAERQAVVGALGSLVEDGKLAARADILPSVPKEAQAELEPQIFNTLTDAVVAYQKSSVDEREQAVAGLLKAIDKASAFIDASQVVDKVLGDLYQFDRSRVVPLDAADRELGGVEGDKAEKRSPFPAGTKTVTLGGIELAVNVDPSSDKKAIPRAANADLVMTATTERNLRLISGSWRKKRPVLLEGPTSAGKTAIVRYIAHKTNTPYRRINMSYFTDVSDLVGRYVGGEKRFEKKDLDKKSEAELRAIGIEYGMEDPKMPLDALKAEILEAQKKPRWVDGPIVKAMKRGEVLLLDEINLARNEVIERLNSLFDDDGNLVLTEHMNEVIRPHDNFRIFATMNPASYAGRTRLSEAMRSRWNNVYAHGLTQADVKTILKTKYQDKIPDVELAKLIATHDNLARLADEGSIGRKTGGIAYSLRNVFRVCERFVRYQGGDLDDAAVMRRETEEIYRGGLFEPDDLRTVDDILATAMPYDGPGFYDNLELKEDGTTFTIGDVVVSKLDTGHQLVPPAKSRLIMTRRTKEVLYRLAKALDMGENVGFIGERACGKTALTKMFAHLRGQPYYRQLFTAGTDGMQLVGGYDHQGWKDGLLLTAGRPENVPGIYLADEFNVGSAAAQERFNSVLDDERKVVLAEKEGEEIRLHKDFGFVAAMNPPTQAYGGREKLSKAMQNRLTLIWVPDLKEHAEMLEVATGRAKSMGVQEAIAEALVDLHAWIVEAYKEGELGKDVRERDRPVYSVRQLMAALEMVAEFQDEMDPGDAFLYAVETVYASSGAAAEDTALILEKAAEIAQ